MAGPDVAINRRQWLLSAVESVYGTNRNPTEGNSGEAIRLLEPFQLDLTQENVEQIGGLGTLGFSRPIATARPAGITFRTFLQGVPTSYSTALKPPLSALYRACGLLETFISSNAAGDPEYQYAPAGRVQSLCSVSLIANVDGHDTRMVGAMGNVNFIMVGASPVIAEFTMRGLLETEVATVRGTPTGLPTTTPPRWVGSGSVLVASLATNIENMNFNTNNRVFEQRASLALSGSGLVRILITERTPGGSFDPEVSNPTSLDWVHIWRSSSGSTIQANVGVDRGNRFSLVMSNAIPKTLAWQDKEGLAVFGSEYQAYESAGNDEYVIRHF